MHGEGTFPNMNRYQQFSPSGYAALLSSFRDKGYEVRSYADVNPSARHLILRHDVDFSLSAARDMADVEAESGVHSTYFVLLRTEFYNPLSGSGLEAMQHIVSRGHTIGLHFDAALYPADNAELETAAQRECGLLEHALGRPVSVLSFHRPAPHLFGSQDRIAGRLNAYAERFVKHMGYCSDSRGDWHHGEPQENPAVVEGRAIQLLTHPFWWQAPATPPLDRLKNFLTERSRLLDSEMRHHCTIYR